MDSTPATTSVQNPDSRVPVDQQPISSIPDSAAAQSVLYSFTADSGNKSSKPSLPPPSFNSGEFRPTFSTQQSYRQDGSDDEEQEEEPEGSSGPDFGGQPTRSKRGQDDGAETSSGGQPLSFRTTEMARMRSLYKDLTEEFDRSPIGDREDALEYLERCRKAKNRRDEERQLADFKRFLKENSLKFQDAEPEDQGSRAGRGTHQPPSAGSQGRGRGARGRGRGRGQVESGRGAREKRPDSRRSVAAARNAEQVDPTPDRSHNQLAGRRSEEAFRLADVLRHQGDPSWRDVAAQALQDQQLWSEFLRWRKDQLAALALPAAPPPAPKKESTIEANLSQMAVKVYSNDPRTEKYCLDNGIPVFKSDQQGMVNPHAYAAGVRYLATAQAMAALHKRGCRKICSVFGSGRDIKIAARLNKDVDPKDQFTLTVYQGVPNVPADFGRIHDNAMSQFAPRSFDGFILVNVYDNVTSTGKKPEGLGLETLRLYSCYGPIAMVMHKFPGYAGVIDETTAWVRPANGNQICLAADGKSQAFMHPACDWFMTDGCSHGLTWWQHSHVGDTFVEMVIEQCPITVQNMRPLTAAYYVQELAVPSVTWIPETFRKPMLNVLVLPELSWMVPKRRGVICTELKNQLVRFMTSRANQGFTMKQLAQKAEQTLLADRDYMLLQSRFPQEMNTVCQDTADAAFMERSSLRDANLLMIRAHHGDHFMAINDSLQHMDQPPTGMGYTRLAVYLGALALLGYGVLRYRASRSSALVGSLATEFRVWWGQTKRLVSQLTPNWMRRQAVSKNQQLPALLPRAPSWGVMVKRWVLWQWFTYKSRVQDARNALPNPLSLISSPYNKFMTSLQLMYDGVQHLFSSFTILQILRDNTHADRSWILLVLLAPFMEEPIKQIPYVMPLLVVLEAVSKLKKNPGDWPGAALAGLMHYATYNIGKKTLIGAILVHFLWNFSCLEVGATMAARARAALQTAPSPGVQAAVGWLKSFKGLGFLGCLSVATLMNRTHEEPSRWQTFRRMQYDDPPQTRTDGPTFVDRPYVSTFTEEEGIVPAQAMPFYEPKPLTEEIVLTNRLTVVDQSPRSSVYFIIAHNVPLYKPDSSDANLEAVFLKRILALPPRTTTAQLDAWIGTSFEWTFPAQEPMVWDQIVQVWLKHLKETDSRKWRRMVMAIKRSGLGFRVPGRDFMRTTQIEIKKNEVLIKIRPLAFAPRPIANVGPDVQYALGPWVYEASARLKALWIVGGSYYDNADSHQHFIHAGVSWTVRISWAGSATDADLMEWMHLALELRPSHIMVLVSGDDSVTAVSYLDSNLERHVQFRCGDMGMMDQSVSSGPLLDEYTVLERLGVPSEVTRALYKLAHATYVAYSRWGGGTIKANRTHRPCRDTGGPDTSVGNSIVMASAFVRVMSRVGPLGAAEAWQDAFSALGMNYKVRETNDPRAVDFLKGKWYSTRIGLVWGPLPSRVLKMTKAIVNPAVTYRAEAHRLMLKKGIPPSKFYSVCCKLHLQSVASSHRPFVAVPIVRALVARWGKKDPLPLEPHKIQASGRFEGLEVQEDDDICERYGCSPEDIRWLEEQYAQVPLFTFIEHPLFWQLALRDYN